ACRAAGEAAGGRGVGAGDALVLRWGGRNRGQPLGPPPPPGRPGLHAATLPWLHQRGVSIIVSDASHDVDPSGYPTIGLPIHKVGIVAMGLWLLDAADCEALVDVCRRLRRWGLMFVVAPWRFHHATDAPVAPPALL